MNRLLTTALLLALPAVACAELHRYWPRFPRPKELLKVPFVGNHELGMTFETAAGLAAAAVLRGEYDTMLYEDMSGNSGYVKWDQKMLALVQPEVAGPVDVWEAVGKLREAGVVKGYILFRYDAGDRAWFALGPRDESANVATTLAGLLGGVAVSEGLREKAEELGLPLLMDVRDRDEAWCLETYGDQCGTRSLMLAEPKSRMARSMGVAMRAFCSSGPGPSYEAALARCEPDCPVIGWGCGGEDQVTMPSTEWGLFQTATNWCHNLPVYSTEEPGKTIPAETISLPERCRRSAADIELEEGVHYACFLMSDGDNVQWLMGNFAGGSEGRWYYESPARGRFPFGWTLCYESLAQVCPYTLVDLFERATPRDDFVLYGGGYFYPDHFGAKREGDVLRIHARRMGEYMRLGGIRTIAFNAQDWDGEAARHAYDVFAEEIPELDGIFTVQYYPYSGGEGRIIWAGPEERRVPVISCRLTIWASTGRPRDTTPAATAKWVNELPTGGQEWTEDNFSFVMPHCWSRFRDTKGDPSPTAEEEGVDQGTDAEGTARGMLPVEWCVDRLEDHVKVVTPHELALLVRECLAPEGRN